MCSLSSCTMTTSRCSIKHRKKRGCQTDTIPRQTGSLSHMSRRIQRSNHLDVHVQRIVSTNKENSTMVVNLKESGHPVLRSTNAFQRGFWTRKVEYARSTSMRNLRMQNSCFAQFTQQISSVSSEQLRVGVKNWLSWHMIKRTWAWRNCREGERWVISTNWNCKKRTPKYKHPGGMIKQREANQEHAESVRCLVKIQIPDSLPWSGGTRHYWSSSSSQNHMLPLINTESKYRCRQHQKTGPKHGLSFPEA